MRVMDRRTADEPRLCPLMQTYPEGVVEPLAMVCRYLMRLYENSLLDPEYVFLCLQDYLELLDELTRLYRFSNSALSSDGSALYDGMGQNVPWVKLANPATGKFCLTSTLPDVPRSKELSRAHLAFSHWGYERLPDLRSGEIMVLVPCRKLLHSG